VSGAELSQLLGGPGAKPFERMVNEQYGISDFVTWTTALSDVAKRVCCIVTRTGKGTGFLVSADVILTNHHVVGALLDGRETAGDVRIMFDYKGGATGEMHRLHASDWHIAGSPPDMDIDPEPTAMAEAAPDKLDFALLRLASKPGESRGVIRVKKQPHDFGAERQLYIVQHPLGSPLSLAIDSDAIIEQNSNGSRVRYRTNTEVGSSGSPCFDKDWQWVALHHSGDLNNQPKWNEGIPAETLLAYLENIGIRDIVMRAN
jgi:hypothetical protein